MTINNKVKAKLLSWYQENHRNLPWRETKDPYAIWLSEVMLQQTTVKAVIPYYERFLKKFPTAKTLASSSIEDIYELWSGLGYYSRARMLHKSAAIISQNGFPKTHDKLLDLPGFGPYTSRAVASFAFNENVGVLDGNSTRFLVRFFGYGFEWWQQNSKKILQKRADEFVQNVDSAQMNQALIEIGATLCTPQNPSCLLCPLRLDCTSYKKNLQEKIPLKKIRKKLEIWIWEPEVLISKNKIALVANNYAPFLKKQLLFPGSVRQKKQPPKNYHYKHNITHHEIYVKIRKVSKKCTTKDSLQWYTLKDIKKVAPVSLLQKALLYI